MPTFPYANDFSAFVQPGGQITLEAEFETFVGSGIRQPVSSPLITIAPVSGGAAVIGPIAPQGIDTATYQYAWQASPLLPPGDYLVTWTGVAPAGTLTIVETVTCVSPPGETPGPGTYATYAQYQEWSGDVLTPQVRVTPALRRASEQIDMYCIGAVYTTDADGMPVQPHVIDALMRATSAQCQFILANNDPANVKAQFASSSMGGVSQTRTARAQGQVFPPLGPAAAVILREVGILPQAPLTGW